MSINKYYSIQGILRVLMRPGEIENATHNTFPKLTISNP
jgi:hypothetical protein